ncbi:MAG: HigA family addiction module antidote protein [Rhizobiales bacterium]|nr:HigA family addiction module antidote protein [Hyphomicrobiales bacterium]
MKMKNPSRPGLMVGNIIIDLEITVTQAAKLLGVTRQNLSNLIHKNTASVSPEMAMRLEAVFGSTAESWLRNQASYDASIIRQRAEEIQDGLNRFQPDAA